MRKKEISMKNRRATTRGMRGLLAGLLLLSTAGFTAQAQAGVALGATA